MECSKHFLKSKSSSNHIWKALLINLQISTNFSNLKCRFKGWKVGVTEFEFKMTTPPSWNGTQAKTIIASRHGECTVTDLHLVYNR